VGKEKMERYVSGHRLLLSTGSQSTPYFEIGTISHGISRRSLYTV
jgi:hypothetical protein